MRRASHSDRPQTLAPLANRHLAHHAVAPGNLHRQAKMVGNMPHTRFVLIPISDATRGHGTHTVAAVWENYLIELLQQSEPAAKP